MISVKKFNYSYILIIIFSYYCINLINTAGVSSDVDVKLKVKTNVKVDTSIKVKYCGESEINCNQTNKCEPACDVYEQMWCNTNNTCECFANYTLNPITNLCECDEFKECFLLCHDGYKSENNTCVPKDDDDECDGESCVEHDDIVSTFMAKIPNWVKYTAIVIVVVSVLYCYFKDCWDCCCGSEDRKKKRKRRKRDKEPQKKKKKKAESDDESGEFTGVVAD